jgi:hypothetical protein
MVGDEASREYRKVTYKLYPTEQQAASLGKSAPAPSAAL